jgi:hypothetical protein
LFAGALKRAATTDRFRALYNVYISRGRLSVLVMDISASINTFGGCEVKIGNDMSKELVVGDH